MIVHQNRVILYDDREKQTIIQWGQEYEDLLKETSELEPLDEVPEGEVDPFEDIVDSLNN